MEVQVIVKDHAVYRSLLRHSRISAEPKRQNKLFERTRDEIATEALASFHAGRRARQKQRGFLLYREKARPLPPTQHFVWSADGQRGWIVARANDGTLTVVTALRRVASIPA